MIVNGKSLLAAAPLSPMLDHKARAHGVSHGCAEAGYDIRVKQEIQFFPPDPVLFARIASNGELGGMYDVAARAAHQGYVRVDGKETYGRFALASSVESFQMPNDLLGIVHDKSTWAREGVSVLNTVIEPGWGPHPDRPDEGCFLTLEIVFHGNKPITIPAGAGIAQVIFHRIEEPAAYSGKYQGQPDRPVAAVMEGE